jgi:hypothetical protein
MFIALRNPDFENTAGRCLAQDSPYLRLGNTLCSGENPQWGDQAASADS